MNSVVDKLYSLFWDEYFWLPENVTWATLANEDSSFASDKVRYPEFRDIYPSMIIGLAILPIRFLAERYLIAPFGKANGLKEKFPLNNVPVKNLILEKAFQANGLTKNHKQIQGLAKQLDWSEREVERWLRKRKLQQGKCSVAKKFSECGWKFLYYVTAFCYGIWCLYDKPWLWNVSRCWDNYPHQHVTLDIYVYYTLEMSLYWSLLYSHCYDTRRKDFWEMFAHHLTTITLLIFSWTCNFVRVGTLILLLNDIGDVFLESGKMAKYLNRQTLTNVIFIVFMVTWFITRLGIFPYKILTSTYFETATIVPPFPGYYFFNMMLAVLLVLNAFWSYYILRILVNTIKAGNLERDVRSETDSDS